jgi:hypothetical protein
MIWLYLAIRKSGDDAHARNDLEDRAKRVLSCVWPYDVIELFLRQKGEDETRRAPHGNADYECEMHFYVGVWRRLEGKDGKADLHEALSKCRQEFIEYHGAKAELNPPRN